ADRGNELLIAFFASWCPHCAAKAPHLAKLATALPADPHAILAINGDHEDAASVFAYHVYFGLPFPAVLDPNPTSEPVTFPTHGPPGAVSLEYHVAYYPTFYVVDPNGRIAW